MDKLKQDEQYDIELPETLLSTIGLTPDTEITLNTVIAGDLKEYIAEKRNIDNCDSTLTMEHVKDIRVTYDYISELLAELDNKVHEHDTEGSTATRTTITQESEQMDDERVDNNIRSSADALVHGETQAETYPVQEYDVKSMITHHINQNKRLIIRDFKTWWGVSDIPTDRLINTIVEEHTLGEDDLNATGALNSIRLEGTDTYKTDDKDEKVRTLSPIKFRKQFRTAFAEFADT